MKQKCHTFILERSIIHFNGVSRFNDADNERMQHTEEANCISIIFMFLKVATVAVLS